MSRGFVVAAVIAFSAPVVAAVGYVATSSEPTSGASVPARVLPGEERRLSGVTSQDRSFGLRLSPDGRRIVLLRVSYEASCLGDEMKMALDDRLYTPIPIAADGRFRVTNLGKRISLNGRIVDGRAKGTFRIAMVYGGLLACKTAPIRFSASV